MKKIALLLAACVVVGCTSETAPDSSSSPDAAVDSSSVVASTAPEGETIVIDVRSEEEWNSGHVKQAFHIPHTEIAERISEVTDDRDAKIVVYCAVGGRAAKAKAKLEELGYTNVENGGGYNDVKDRLE